MTNGKSVAWVLGVALVTCLLPARVVAQGSYNLHEKGIERINDARKVAPLSIDRLFGDQISHFNGGAEFYSVDISVPGNNDLPVELRRALTVDDRSRVNGLHLGGFAEWDLDIPRLSSEVATAKGWHPAGGTVNQRCSVPGPMEDIISVAAEDYWNGYRMHIPGDGDQSLLMNSSPMIPSAGGGPHPWITKNMWRISCKSSTKNGYPGEAFVATSPQGVRYHLDWVVARQHSSVNRDLNSFPVFRQAVHFLVSRVEDRFGNWVDFTYSSDKLIGITSSDSRQITITWTGSKITSASSSVGNWSYSYTGEKLSQVTLPDASKWSYVSTGALAISAPGWSPPIEDPTGCPDSLEEPMGAYTLGITAPSSATAQYTFQVRQHYRSNVPENACYINSPQYWFMKVPRFNWSLTLVSKVVSGPGLPAMTWSYNYGFPNIYVGAMAKESTVSGPDGTFIRYVYGTDYNVNEGQLLITDRGSSASNILWTRASSYVTRAEAGSQYFPDAVGEDPKLWSDLLASSWLRPLKQLVTTQQGVNFSWQVNTCSSKYCFDVFARATSVTKSSTVSGSPSKVEQTEYYDAYFNWVLGQIKKSTTGSIVVSETTFNSQALPQVMSSFGKVRRTISYHGDGTISTLKDGNNNIVTLSDWYRGIPRLISYPDSTTQSAVVSTAGWVTTTTDQNGFSTSYSYDAMGRLASIVYPTADSTVWNTTTQVFEKIGSVEHGIPAGHWRQTISTGNARKIAFYDGLWRPLVTQEYDTANMVGTQRFQRFAYDHEGRTTFASYPGANSSLTVGTSTGYDALGRPVLVSQSSELGILNSTWEYLTGFKTRTTDPRSQQITTSYLAYDQPSTDLPVAVLQPEGVNVDIARDVLGKPTSLTQRNASNSTSITRRYVYDSYQQLCKSIEPETASTVMTYDNVGNLSWSASGQALPSTSSCDADSVATGQKVIRTYDARNRLTALTFADGNGSQNWVYTPDGLPDTITTWNEGGHQYGVQHLHLQQAPPAGQ